MSQFPTQPEVVVIGAGAAGIGAGLSLQRHGVPFVIIEAKQRVGGRAYSESSSLGHLWDQGCHWFHTADRNVLRAMADKIGHGYRKELYDGGYRAFDGRAWQPLDIRNDYVWDKLAEIAVEGGKADVAVEGLLDRAEPGYPTIRHWCQLMYSQDPEDISARDAHNYLDTHVNLAVTEGYGGLVAKLAQGLPIRLSTAAERIAVTASGVSVATSAGTIAARACILAVPARMLEEGRIAIAPGLPSALEQAFHDVPMGHYEKIGFAFDGPVLSELGVGYADILADAASGLPALNIEVHPFGRPILVSHLGGSKVAGTSAADRIDILEQAVARAFGADVRRRITRRATTAWTADPFINGAYSCARPGRAHQRARFADPVHERIFLAGEHTHPHFFATAHGAFETGQMAAGRALRHLGRTELTPDPTWLPANPL